LEIAVQEKKSLQTDAEYYYFFTLIIFLLALAYFYSSAFLPPHQIVYT